jgi:hypothetical protein
VTQTHHMVEIIEGGWQVDVLHLIRVSIRSFSSRILKKSWSLRLCLCRSLTAGSAAATRGFGGSLGLEAAWRSAGTTSARRTCGSSRWCATTRSARTRLRAAATGSWAIETTRMSTITTAKGGFGWLLASRRTAAGTSLTLRVRHDGLFC